jgi:hypothetical protein
MKRTKIFKLKTHVYEKLGAKEVQRFNNNIKPTTYFISFMKATRYNVI